MAPKGAQYKQWRAALDKVVERVKKELMLHDVTDDTPDDEKYTHAGAYFQQKYPGLVPKT